MDLNRFLYYSIIVGIFALLFVPLYVSSEMFFPFITGKNFAFRILVELMAAAYLILSFRDASYRPKKTWLLGAFAVFILIVAVADIFGDNFYRSFWSNYERMEGLITHLHLFAYFVLVSVVLTTQKLWDRFFQTSLAVSVVLGIYGIRQLLGQLEIHQGAVRLDATLGNATYLAVYMLFHIFIAAMFLFRPPASAARAGEGTEKNMRFVYGAILLLDTFILYYTATRGAMLGLLGGILVSSALIVYWNREDRRIRKWALGGIVAVFLVVGGVYLAKDTGFIKDSPVLSRFASISLSETTTKSRFLIWNMSFQGVKENPLLGYGQENYIVVFNKHYHPGMYAQEPWFDRSHNVFLDWLISGGALGLLSYLSLFAITLYYIVKGAFSPSEKSFLVGLLAAYFFQNIFVFDNLISYILFFSMLAYISFRYHAALPPRAALLEQAMPNELVKRIYVPVVLTATLLLLYFANVKPILAGATLIEALKPQQAGLSENLRLFEKSLAYQTFGRGETREQLIQAAVRVQQPTVSGELRERFYQAARRETLLQIEENPKDARYELFFASFLNRFGLYDEALEHLERARELSPRKQAVRFEIGTSYLAKGEYQKALAIFKEAYELEPNYREARLLYGMAALYARNDVLAAELLVPIYGTLLVPEDRIINAYAVRKEYGKVAELWKMRVAAEPNNINHRAALAAAYLELGRRAEAIAELRKISEIQPNLKGEVDALIRRIQAGEKVF